MSDVHVKNMKILCWKCQWSMQPASFINVDRAQAILDGDTDLELERSKFGSITQFKSPPKIRWCKFMLGRMEMSLFIKLASAQLGAYTQERITYVLKREPLSDKSALSDIDSLRINCIFLWINIAVPLAIFSLVWYGLLLSGVFPLHMLFPILVFQCEQIF